MTYENQLHASHHPYRCARANIDLGERIVSQRNFMTRITYLSDARGAKGIG